MSGNASSTVYIEYETEEIAEYAVKLFTGLVVLYNRTLKFAISGQDRPSQSLQNGPITALNNKPRPHPSFPTNNVDISHQSMRLSATCRVSAYPHNYSQVPVSHGVTYHHNGYGSQFNGINYDSGRRVVGSPFDTVSRFRSRRYDSSNHASYPSY
ncbi:uncharacterized protein LOC105635716 isoform X2 [Jatropha curcas]|uniref:uncharacterized protein LOC105635716 isoform X2 n=1 Tax=Jatropha curcas TaxID=180498 RepID=UPI0005FBFD5E|nr:uncharacterized protein LOC105635716 isoform X2 [Jatropha curcas]